MVFVTVDAYGVSLDNSWLKVMEGKTLRSCFLSLTLTLNGFAISYTYVFLMAKFDVD